MRVEKLIRGRLHAISPADVRAGDEVDVPVWIDVWFPEGRLNLNAFAFFSFDRLIVLDG